MDKNDYLKPDGTLKTIKNNPDIYVNVKCKDGNNHLIPIHMPRRMPNLSFDPKNPDEALWAYLQKWESSLNKTAVDEWKKEQLSLLQDRDSPSKTDGILKALLSQPTVCYKCYSDVQSNPNPQKNIQYIRDRGYVVCTLKAFCPKCNQKTTTYALTPIMVTAKQDYEQIPKRLKLKICKVFDFTDAYSGIQNKEASAHIPDHKFPEDRWNENTPVQNKPEMTVTEIKNRFQLLSIQTNLQKQRFCSKCVKNKKRGYPFGIKFFYAGNEDWDNNIPEKGAAAERGCVGCGWYDLLKWKEELNKFIRSNSDR